MASVSKSFTAAAQVSGPLFVNAGDAFTYAITGTWVATLVLERSSNLNAWEQVAVFTANASNRVIASSKDQAPIYYRLRSSAYTSGTAVTTLLHVPVKEKVINVSAAGHSKVGGTAGFVVAVASNTALVTCPASQTASKLVVPIPRLEVGDVITGFYLIGQIESAGATATVDADLRVMTAAAADVTDASVGSMTQLSVTAQTIMSRTNTAKLDLIQPVGVDETYYLLCTVTTAALTDIALQGIGVIVKA